MFRKVAAMILVAAEVLCLCGCGSLFDKEYVSVTDYNFSAAAGAKDDGKVTVKNMAGLKQAILNLAYSGENGGVIVFSQDYDGDTTEDIASACWQVRTRDALCAYCVENISYEINKIVTINEATLRITYSQHADSPQNISFLSYSYPMESLIRTKMENAERHFVILVSRSTYEDAEQLESLISKIYRSNPLLLPRKPHVSINMYSGTGTQRLFELSVSYMMSEDELIRQRHQLEEIRPVDAGSEAEMTEAQKAIAAVQYLTEICEYSNEGSRNTAYSALIEHAADSEGMALGYVALCQKLGLDAQIIYGQKNWSDHCWAIVKVDGSYYHVDPVGAEGGMADITVLGSDQTFWGTYRWDVAAYPKCSGPLSYAQVINGEA